MLQHCTTQVAKLVTFTENLNPEIHLFMSFSVSLYIINDTDIHLISIITKILSFIRRVYIINTISCMWWMMEAIEAFLKERNTSCKKRFNENNKESESLEKSESLVVYLSNHFPLTCLVPLFMDYIFRCQHSRN